MENHRANPQKNFFNNETGANRRGAKWREPRMKPLGANPFYLRIRDAVALCFSALPDESSPECAISQFVK
jgi:hypothetical protein